MIRDGRDLRATPEGARWKVVAAVAATLFVSLLLASLFVPGQRWEVSYVRPGAEDVLLDPGTRTLYTSSPYLLGQFRRSGTELNPQGWVRTGDMWPYGSGGPLALKGDWLFFMRDDGRLTLFNVSDWPRDGRFHNLTDVDHRGPVRVTPAFGFFPGAMAWFGPVAFFGDTLLIAGHTHDEGRVLAVDMSQPQSVTEDPTSLTTSYNLNFVGAVLDLQVVEQALYVLERTASGSALHILDPSRQPPEARFTFPLDWYWRFDVQGSLICLAANTTASLFRVAGDRLDRLSSVALPEDFAGGIELVGGRLYVGWGSPERWTMGVSIFDTSDESAPRELWHTELDRERSRWPTAIAVDADAAYLSGERSLVVMIHATRPSILTSLPLSLAVVTSGVGTILAVGGVWRASRTRPSETMDRDP